MDWGIFLLRLVVGLTLSAHGVQKLFGWFGGSGLSATGQVMERLGFASGRRSALMAGLAEGGGGLILALGLLTPVAAAGCFGVMFVAAVSAHLKNGFFVQNRGYEYTLVLGLAALSVAFTGAGALSVDALVGLHFGGIRWGLAVLLAGLAGGGVQLAMRRPPKIVVPNAAGSSPQKV